MQLIKEKHQSIGRDINIKIPLGSNSDLNGLNQSIDEYNERELSTSINTIVDGETFRYKGSYPKIFEFNFYSGSSTYAKTLLAAGFTQDDIDNRTDLIFNSFYIMQIYDTINRENQTLLHNSYYNGIDISELSTIYSILHTKEFSNIYIPEWYINSTNNNYITLYCTFLFFNAKTGKLQVFYNEDNELLTTEEKMYHTMVLNKSLKVYEFEGSYITSIKCKELNNSDYVNRINESLSSFNNETPNFPTGNKFKIDGKYEIII